MTTIHVSPESSYADDALELVEEFAPDVWITVQGERVDFGDDLLEYILSVSECPCGPRPWEHGAEFVRSASGTEYVKVGCRTYMRAKDWLSRYGSFRAISQ